MGGARRFGTRAVGALLLTGLAAGVVAGVIVTPGPTAGASGSPSALTMPRSTLTSHSAPVVDEGKKTGPAESSPVATALPATLTDPAPAASGPVADSDPTTEAQVARDLITAVDTQSSGAYAIPATSSNVSLLETWMDNEGGLWADNPLNTSLDASRYPHQLTTGGEDTGIPIFPTIELGTAATATTLLTNHAYADILEVLRAGSASCVTFARAVMSSPWAASHYGGDPSHFCGTSGGSSTVPVVTTACLRLPNGHRQAGRGADRMPGDCGRHAATGSGHLGRGTRHHPGSGGAAGVHRPAHGHSGRRATPRSPAGRRGRR